jgi:predicted LPLAT superfamily acyltransferase
MATLPLIVHDRSDAVVAWRDGVPVRVRQTERDAAIRQAGGAYAASLERYCRAEPFNWFNCFDFWWPSAGGCPTPS